MARVSAKPRPRRRHEEHDNQAMVVKWAAIMEHKYPALKLLFAVPNAGIAGGARRGGWLKAEGVKAGVPDLMLPYGYTYSNTFCGGLAIEMKTKTGRISPEQAEWHELLKRYCWEVAVCRSAEEAIETISRYLGIPTA